MSTKSKYMVEIHEKGEDREAQKEYLKNKYPDYNPKRHGVFVRRHNEELEKERIKQYMTNRGILSTVDTGKF